MAKLVCLLIFDEYMAGQRETFGYTSSTYNLFHPFKVNEQPLVGLIVHLKIYTSRKKKTFGQVDLPLVFSESIFGQRETFGSVAFPINATFAIIGQEQGVKYGQLSMGLLFEKEVVGFRKTFGQFTSPFVLGTAVETIRESFGKIDSSIDFLIDVKTGRVEAFSQIAFEILIGLEVAGIIRPTSIILNLAQNIYLGSSSVDAVYSNNQKVWPTIWNLLTK